MTKLVLFFGVLFFVGCSTTTSFVVPKGADLYVEERLVPEAEYGEYTRSPFFWSRSSGIPYRIEKNNQVIDEGKIKSHFRVASIFWPPAAIIYWPLRFEGRGYNFTKRDNFVRRAEEYKKDKKTK
jgi:hypothetical protein